MNTNTPPVSRPLSSIPCGYKAKLRVYGKAPEGYRFLKVGERFNQETDFCLSAGKKWAAFAANVVGIGGRVYDANYPCITPLLSKRDSRGRFVGAKPLPEVGPNILKWLGHRDINDDYLVKCVANLKKVIADPANNRTSVMALNWGDSPQGSQYWLARHNGREPISPADILYIKATIAAYENRIAELRGKIKPPATALPDIGPAMKEWLGGYGSDKISWLSARADNLQKAVDNPVGKSWEIMDMHWASTPQGGSYWSNRCGGPKSLSASDVLYIKAVVAAHRERVKELTREPTVAELKAKISSLEAENAALKAKIAGAKVTFPS